MFPFNDIFVCQILYKGKKYFALSEMQIIIEMPRIKT